LLLLIEKNRPPTSAETVPPAGTELLLCPYAPYTDPLVPTAPEIEDAILTPYTLTLAAAVGAMLGATVTPKLLPGGFPKACRTYSAVPACGVMLPMPAVGKNAPPPLFTDASVLPPLFCHS